MGDIILSGGASSGGGGGGSVTQGTTPWIVAGENTTVTGTLSAPSTSIELDTDGMGSCVGQNIQQTGGFSQNLNFQGSNDGGTVWNLIPFSTANDTQTLRHATGVVTVNDTYFQADIAGWTKVRLNIGAAITGTTTWNLTCSQASTTDKAAAIAGKDGNLAGVSPSGLLYVDASGTTINIAPDDLDGVTPTTEVFPIGAVYNDAITAATATKMALLRSSHNRALHTNLRNDSGTEIATAVAAPAGAETALVVRNIPSGTQAISAASLPLPTGAATAGLQTQPGVDIGDVTINNAAGASAVNIQDGGNSITVDGALTSVATITNVVHVDDNAGSLTVDNPILSVVGGGVEATAQRVTIASDSTGVLSVDDNGGSLTIDAVSLPLPTGASTAARQDTGNSSLVDVLTQLQLMEAFAEAGGWSVKPYSPAVTGVGTLVDTVTGIIMDNTNGRTGGWLRLSGEWIATVKLMGSTDGIDYFDIPFANIDDGLLITKTSKNGYYVFPTMGLNFVQIILSAFISGNVFVASYLTYSDSLPQAQLVRGSMKAKVSQSEAFTKDDYQTPTLTPEGRLRVALAPDTEQHLSLLQSVLLELKAITLQLQHISGVSVNTSDLQTLLN